MIDFSEITEAGIEVKKILCEEEGMECEVNEES